MIRSVADGFEEGREGEFNCAQRDVRTHRSIAFGVHGERRIARRVSAILNVF